MKVKIKLTHPNTKIPTYAHDTDACFDLYAAEKIYDPHNDIIEYNTGIAIEIPEDHVGLVFQRSSVCKTPHLLRNTTGVIDASYRGNIICKFLSITRNANQYEVGDRIAQMMIIPRPKIEFEQVDELEPTLRGEGGFGSSNVKETTN